MSKDGHSKWYRQMIKRNRKVVNEKLKGVSLEVELIGKEEQKAVSEVFEEGGILFSHGFDY